MLLTDWYCLQVRKFHFATSARQAHLPPKRRRACWITIEASLPEVSKFWWHRGWRWNHGLQSSLFNFFWKIEDCFLNFPADIVLKLSRSIFSQRFLQKPSKMHVGQFSTNCSGERHWKSSSNRLHGGNYLLYHLKILIIITQLKQNGDIVVCSWGIQICLNHRFWFFIH